VRKSPESTIEGNKDGLYPEEERIVRKAVPFNQRRQNLKHFLFTDTETLIDDITQIYPTIAFVTIVNNDERDAKNTPRITFRTLNRLHITVHKVRSHNGRLFSESLTSVTGSFKTVLCVVENGFVTVKKNSLKFDGE